MGLTAVCLVWGWIVFFERYAYIMYNCEDEQVAYKNAIILCWIKFCPVMLISAKLFILMDIVY